MGKGDAVETKPERTALQDDYSYRAVDDYNTRTYLLPVLSDPERRSALIAEHRARPIYTAAQPGEPVPMDSSELSRLLDRLRVVPQQGKHVIVETEPWQEYRIGLLPGVRGVPVEVTEERYPSREDAEHAIFLKRLGALLEAYGIQDSSTGA